MPVSRFNPAELRRLGQIVVSPERRYRDIQEITGCMGYWVQRHMTDNGWLPTVREYCHFPYSCTNKFGTPWVKYDCGCSLCLVDSDRILQYTRGWVMGIWSMDSEQPLLLEPSGEDNLRQARVVCEKKFEEIFLELNENYTYEELT